MSPITETLSRIRSTPIDIVVRKGLHKLERSIIKPYQRWNAVRKPTYSVQVELPNKPFQSLITLPPREQCKEYQPIVEALANEYIHHRFDVLGSGWVENKHGVHCKGLGGYSYKPQHTDYTTDNDGEWIDFVIRKINAPLSKSIWQLIDFPYTPIDWQRDIKSGYSWSEDRWYKDITIGYGKGIDAKVPWELARFHHLLHLAVAHYYTDNTSFRNQLQREFRNQVLDFIAMNPPQFGIQWKSSMDVAIRIANIMVAYDLFTIQGVQFDDDFVQVLRHSTYEHAYHVYQNLEWSEGMRGNHYLANICGLLIAACYLPDFPEQKLWMTFAVDELYKEILYQFNPDGANFEASVPYHRLSTEMVVWALAILKKATSDYTVPIPVQHRLQAIYRFTSSYMYSSGYAPQVGDNDSGRFLPLFPTVYLTKSNSPIFEYQQHSHVLAGLEALLGAPVTHKHPEYDVIQELVGTNSSVLTPDSNKCEPSFLHSITKGNFELRIRAGEIGQNGKGGHAHNDQLSFTLAVRGVEFFVDTGTYLYASIPEERNKFRSTAMHNTLQVLSAEQNTWNKGTLDSLFWLKGDNTKTTVLLSTESEWQGEHVGYNSPHKRKFVITETEITITDDCAVQEEKNVYFHIHPACICTPVNAHTVKISRNSIELELTSEPHALQTLPSVYSRGYGLCEPSAVLIVTGKENEFRTHIRFTKSG